MGIKAFFKKLGGAPKESAELRAIKKSYRKDAARHSYAHVRLQFPLNQDDWKLLRSKGKYITFLITDEPPQISEVDLNELMLSSSLFPRVASLATQATSPKSMEILSESCAKLLFLIHLSLTLHMTNLDYSWPAFERIQSLTLTPKRNENVGTFLQRMECPDLRELTIVNHLGDASLLEKASTCYPNLELFKAKNSPENSFSFQVDLKARLIHTVYARAPGFEATLEFKQGGFGYPKGFVTKDEVVAKCQEIQAILEGERRAELLPLLPFLETAYVEIHLSGAPVGDLLGAFEKLELFVDGPLTPALLPRTLAARSLFFEKKGGIASSDINWIVRAFPDLEALGFRQDIGRVLLEGSFRNLKRLSCPTIPEASLSEIRANATCLTQIDIRSSHISN